MHRASHRVDDICVSVHGIRARKGWFCHGWLCRKQPESNSVHLYIPNGMSVWKCWYKIGWVLNAKHSILLLVTCKIAVRQITQAFELNSLIRSHHKDENSNFAHSQTLISLSWVDCASVIFALVDRQMVGHWQHTGCHRALDVNHWQLLPTTFPPQATSYLLDRNSIRKMTGSQSCSNVPRGEKNASFNVHVVCLSHVNSNTP